MVKTLRLMIAEQWQKITILSLIIFNVAIKMWFVYFNPYSQFTVLGGDAAGYNYAATHFLEWFFSTEVSRPPVYIGFLKILYLFSGIFSLDKIKFVFFIQEMLNVLTLIILLLISDIIFSQFKGKSIIKVIVAFCYVLYFPFINANAVLLRGGLNSFLVVLFIFFLLKYHITVDSQSEYNILNRCFMIDRKKLYLFLFSLSFSLCYLNRDENVLFLFFILLMFAFPFFFKHKKELKRDIILLAIFLYLFNYPWVMRNLLISQKNIFLSSGGGINMAMGLMYEYPIYDDLRCPYLTEMFGLYVAKLNESGSSFHAIQYFFYDMFFNHSPIEVFRFYLNKFYSSFKEPLIFHNYYQDIQIFMFSPAFQKMIHKLYLSLFILSLPFLWLHRKKTTFWMVYILLFFVMKIIVALIIWGSPRTGFSMVPFIILFASFSVYCICNIPISAAKFFITRKGKHN